MKYYNFKIPCNLCLFYLGETGAGKSSFINLLLGTSILPTSNLPCTATVCELRTSPDGRKSAVLKYKNIEDRKRRQPPRVLDLHNAAELRELADCIENVDDLGESPFERIEIYWPFPILQVILLSITCCHGYPFCCKIYSIF